MALYIYTLSPALRYALSMLSSHEDSRMAHSSIANILSSFLISFVYRYLMYLVSFI